jgi:hypothetical protein
LGEARSPTDGHDEVLVQVVDLNEGRQIGWGSNAAEALGHRARDLQRGISAGVGVVRAALADIGPVDSWSEREVSATFSVTLAAESGVVLARASTEASLEVTVTYRTERS